MGFKYEVRKKYYFVDGHEKDDTKRYRKKFCKEMLELEKRQYRWIQISEDQAKEYEEKYGLIRACGEPYLDATTNTRMVEYHIDACEKFHELMEDSEFGGNLSKNFEEGTKPVIVLGHDECIFKQNQFTSKSWTSDTGKRTILPKDEGAGVMISAFQCREYGFGFELSAEEIEKVNRKQRGELYVDEEAAMLKNGKKNKPDLESSPFVVESEYGAQAKGYWCYEHFVLQCEDVADCLAMLYLEVEFHFLVDHSCGHNCQRINGLNASQMNKGFRGEQRVMHTSKINAEDGYLGPFWRQLQVRDMQSFVFSKQDQGPFWMSAKDRYERLLYSVFRL